MPVKINISSRFGEMTELREYHPHTGIDIPMKVGTKLRSFVDGTVERIVNDNSLGHGVVVRGVDGNTYTYGHMDKVVVKVGQHLEAGGDIIGTSGNSGHSTGPHLHFAIQLPDGGYVNPEPAVKALEQVTGGDPYNRFWGEQPMPGSFFDRINHFYQGQYDDGKQALWETTHPIAAWFKNLAFDLGHWIVHSMPELLGYGAMLAGAACILGSFTGKGGYLKPLLYYGAALIIGVLLRSGANDGS